jgi:hypothetical protein
MRCKLFLLSGIMGLAVISGIIKGLSAPRGGPKKEEEKAGKKEESAGDENPAN